LLRYIENIVEEGNMTVPDSTSASLIGLSAVSPSGDNERAEIVKDNEALETASTSKAPLPDYQGKAVDAEA